MPLNPHSPPPRQWLEQDGKLTRAAAEWLETLYRKLGQASMDAPIRSENITGLLAAKNQVPNAQANVTNRATVDSVDAGSTATIRVYGAGGVGTQWTREVAGKVEGTFPAGTMPGFAYGVTRDIYYSDANNTFLAFDPDTQFAESLKDEYRWVGRVKTVSAGGTGGTTGGGGSTGGSGGAPSKRYVSSL